MQAIAISAAISSNDSAAAVMAPHRYSHSNEGVGGLAALLML